MRTPAIVCLALCFSLLPGTAKAEPFTVLPNGDLVFNVALSTTATLGCGLVRPCTGSGTDTLIVGSGPGALSLTFTGAERTLQVGNSTVPVSLGTLTATTSDPDFTFPTLGPHVPVAHLNLVMTLTSPVPGTIHSSLWFGPGGGKLSAAAAGPRFLRVPGRPESAGIRLHRPDLHVRPVSVHRAPEQLAGAPDRCRRGPRAGDDDLRGERPCGGGVHPAAQAAADGSRVAPGQTRRRDHSCRIASAGVRRAARMAG